MTWYGPFWSVLIMSLRGKPPLAWVVDPSEVAGAPESPLSAIAPPAPPDELATALPPLPPLLLPETGPMPPPPVPVPLPFPPPVAALPGLAALIVSPLAPCPPPLLAVPPAEFDWPPPEEV